jgi:dipeptidyl aminopeptidase/acylaminoacyl peptidase
LPPGHQQGQRLPLLVWFYPITEYRADAPSSSAITDVSFANMAIPASHGYAVLLASIRIPPVGVPTVVRRDLHEQLIHAAENVVDLGYADPGRWAIFGHSYGGFGVNSVITMTDRFKAGVASGSAANMGSLYGSWVSVEQLGRPTIGHIGIRGQLEYGELRMGAAPWGDPAKYVDNSPVFWAGNVRTPLMLIHGDLDQNVPVAQAEEMFTALHRQGKDAVFLRYMGEDHVYASPANIVDMWDRVLEFLDTHLEHRPQ